MKVGELFVNLGIKGTEKTARIITNIKDGLKDVANTSTETKLALVGVVYGLERMMRFSTQMGAGLKSFSAYTRISTDELQRWQYAGRKVNVTNQEVENSFRGVSRAIGLMKIGKGAPEGLAMLAKGTNIDLNKLEDTAYVMTKIQELLTNNGSDNTLLNTIAESFSLSPDMVAGLKQGAFTAEKMKGAPVFSKNQVNTLADMNAKMSEFYNNLQLSMGVFVEKFFPQIVALLDKVSGKLKDISFGISPEDKRSLEGVLIVMEKIADFVGVVASGWKEVFGLISDFKKVYGESGSGGVAKKASSFMDSIYNMFDPNFSLASKVGIGLSKMDIFPKYKTAEQAMGGSNVNINQNINFEGGQNLDMREIKDNFKKTTEETYRQLPIGVMN